MNVLSKEEGLVLAGAVLTDLGKSLKESVGGGREDTELKLGQHFVFHCDNVAASKLVLGDAEQFLQRRRVDLLVFSSDQDRSQAEDVQLTLLNLLDREVSVDDEDSQVEGLGHQAELTVDIDDPLNQEGSAGVFDLSLNLHGLEVVRLDS